MSSRFGGSKAGLNTDIRKNGRGNYDLYSRGYNDTRDFWRLVQADFSSYDDAYQVARQLELSLWDAHNREAQQSSSRQTHESFFSIANESVGFSKFFSKLLAGAIGVYLVLTIIGIDVNKLLTKGLLVFHNLAELIHGSAPEPNQAQITPDSVPATLTSEHPQAYNDGRNARVAFENWFDGIGAGDYHDGAQYWASHRSVKPVPPTCHSTSPAFEQGCLEAKRLLAPSDIRRKIEPEFKAGWNSL